MQRNGTCKRKKEGIVKDERENYIITVKSIYIRDAEMSPEDDGTGNFELRRYRYFSVLRV